MASFREIQTRNVIPNWRSYNKTSQIGELDYAQSRANSVELFPIDSYIRTTYHGRNSFRYDPGILHETLTVQIFADSKQPVAVIERIDENFGV